MGAYAGLLIDLGQPIRAGKLVDSLMALDLDRYSSNARRFSAATSQIGECYRRVERYVDSERILQSSLRAVTGTRLAGRGAQILQLEQLVRLYEDWGKPVQADKYRQMLKQDVISAESPSL